MGVVVQKNNNYTGTDGSCGPRSVEGTELGGGVGLGPPLHSKASEVGLAAGG